MRKDKIMSALSAAAPKPNIRGELPTDVCEQILADGNSNCDSQYVYDRSKKDSSKLARRFTFKRGSTSRIRWSARTLMMTATMVAVIVTTAAASFIALDLPYPGQGGGEVDGPAGYVVYWRNGVLSQVVDCSKTPDTTECRGDLREQDDTHQQTLNQTERLWTSGEDPDAAVLFMDANGGLLSCAGLVACSYMEYQPNYKKPLPPVGTPIPSRYMRLKSLKH